MLDVTFANTVAMSRQTWLWPGRISNGTLMRVKAAMNVKAVKKEGRSSFWRLPQAMTLKEKLGLGQPFDDLPLTD